ncbi:MAG: thioredoxin family protein, partial [Anaerolineae bacterium]|nr:thioredoxin family protein [Anaerolineae bacterium]
HFTSLLHDIYTGLFAHIRQRGVFSSFFVCGDATKNIEPMCKTAPDSISVDENINMVTAKQITDRYNITIGGNIPLTTVMLLGTQQDNLKFAVDFLDQIDHHNLILAPGCDMPYNVPVENVIGVVEAVRDPASVRAMLANYQAREVDTSGVILPAYGELERPLIEVFTLDSATCAACTYMLDAAQRAAGEAGIPFDLVEYKFTEPENVARCVKMGVANLPSIYINGELKYSSLIPARDELAQVIRDAADELSE